MISIIAGRFRGKQLILPDSKWVCPTSQRAREALFSKIMSDDPKGFEFCFEPFAGTGAFSFEAFSRNLIQRSILFEKNPIVCRILQKNSISFPQKLACEIRCEDALKISSVPVGKMLSFIDPPYENAKDGLIVFKKIKELAQAGSLIICEAEKEENLPLDASEIRRYGRAVFGFYPL